MSTWQKILIGGVGALAPQILNLLVVDLEMLLLKVTPIVLLGYAIRVVVLFFLGGFWAFLHKDENSPIKLFQLGIVAPAVIMALLNANNIDRPKSVEAKGKQTGSSMLFVTPAYAQPSASQTLKTFSFPKETPVEQFWRGLTGSKPERIWFVIAGSHAKIEEAQQQVEQINRSQKGFEAVIYAPYAGSPNYSVVIGANLTYKEAQELREKAIAAGLSKATYVWKLPE